MSRQKSYKIVPLWERILKANESSESKINQIVSFFSNKANKKSSEAPLLKLFLGFLQQHQEEAKKYFSDIETRGFEGFSYKAVTAYLAQPVTKLDAEQLLEFFPTPDVRDRFVMHYVRKCEISDKGWQKVVDLLPLVTDEAVRCELIKDFSVLQSAEFGIGFLQQSCGMLRSDSNKANLITRWTQAGHSFDFVSDGGKSFNQIIASIEDRDTRNELVSQILSSEESKEVRGFNLHEIMKYQPFSHEDLINVANKIGLFEEKSQRDKQGEDSSRVSIMSQDLMSQDLYDSESGLGGLGKEQTIILTEKYKSVETVRPRRDFKPTSSRPNNLLTLGAGWETKYFTKSNSNSSR